MCDALADADEIAFSSGQHGEIIKMSYKDYVDLAHPVVMTEGFARPEAKKKKTPSWLLNKRMPQSA
jgi:preprotein translocase subunit YajC